MLSEALTYADEGQPVLPLVGKRPATHIAPRGVYSATTDPRQIQQWWKGGEYNIGGAVMKHHVVLDIDARHGGLELLGRIQATFGELPRTRTTVSGGGGLHLWFRYVGLQKLRRLGAGVDVKQQGGYLVLPPSVHPDTDERYRWEDPLAEVAHLPTWLEMLLAPKPKTDEGLRLPPDQADAASSTDRHYVNRAGWLLLRGYSRGVGGDTSRSGIFWKGLWHLSNANYSLAAVEELANDEQYAGLHSELQSRGHTHLREQYRYVRELQLGLGKVDVEKLNRIGCAIDFSQLHDICGGWKGSAGSNAIVVLKLMLAKALSARNVVLTYPLNSLMLDGQWSNRATVRAALNQLANDGWLHVLKGPNGYKGKTYRLSVPAAIARSAAFREMREPVSLCNQHLALRLMQGLAKEEAFASNASQKDGKVALRIWLALHIATNGLQEGSSWNREEREKKGTISAKLLAFEAGQSKRTVDRHLTRLREEGVVVAAAEGWQLAESVSLLNVARDRGTLGARELIAADVEGRRAAQTERLRERGSSAVRRGRGA